MFLYHVYFQQLDQIHAPHFFTPVLTAFFIILVQLPAFFHIISISVLIIRVHSFQWRTYLNCLKPVLCQCCHNKQGTFHCRCSRCHIYQQFIFCRHLFTDFFYFIVKYFIVDIIFLYINKLRIFYYPH